MQFDIEDADGSVAIVRLTFENLVLEFVGEFKLSGQILTISKFHIQGASPGALGHKTLYRLAEEARAKYGFRQIIIHGSRRTSGRRNGKIPSKIVFGRL